jgi:hypothetical protein
MRPTRMHAKHIAHSCGVGRAVGDELLDLRQDDALNPFVA